MSGVIDSPGRGWCGGGDGGGFVEGDGGEFDVFVALGEEAEGPLVGEEDDGAAAIVEGET
jgi:hypothetical protein